MLKRGALWLGGICAAITVALAILLLIGGPVAAQTAVRIFGTLSGAAKAVAVDSTGRVRVAIEGGGGTFDSPVTINVNGIGTTSTRGISVDNSTAAAAGAQQYSPMACQEGQGWKTTATAASQSVEFCWEVQPVQGTTAPSGNYILKASINGGAFSTVGTFTSGGQVLYPDGTAAAPAMAFASNTGLGFFKQATNSIGVSFAGSEGLRLTGNDIRILSASGAIMTGTAQDTVLKREAAGVFSIGSSGTAGVRLNAATDGTLAIQNFAGTGGAHVTGIRFQTTAVAVSALPTCNSGLEGARAGVTDASVTYTLGVGTTVVGSGANHVPVYCDGTNWVIG